jgi:hypothetical protein
VQPISDPSKINPLGSQKGREQLTESVNQLQHESLSTQNHLTYGRMEGPVVESKQPVPTSPLHAKSTSMPIIQRQAAPPAEAEPVSASSQETEPSQAEAEEKQESDEIDKQELTQQVYAAIRQRLSLERERLRWH